MLLVSHAMQQSACQCLHLAALTLAPNEVLFNSHTRAWRRQYSGDAVRRKLVGFDETRAGALHRLAHAEKAKKCRVAAGKWPRVYRKHHMNLHTLNALPECWVE